MFKFLRNNPERDDKRSKVYFHMNPVADKDGAHLWKVGVTNDSPQARRSDYMRKHPNMTWLAKYKSGWLPINETGDLQDRGRFDRHLKENLQPFQIKQQEYTTNPTEMYRGTVRQILGTIKNTLREHRRGSNR